MQSVATLYDKKKKQRKEDRGHNHIYNSLNKNKISRNKSNQGSEELL